MRERDRGRDRREMREREMREREMREREMREREMRERDMREREIIRERERKERERDKNSNKENISSNISTISSSSTSSKNYLHRRKSSDKISSSNGSIRKYKLGSGNQESSYISQPSPTLSSVSGTSTGSKSSTMKKSYSSTTLSKYDLPHMSSLNTDSSSSRRYGSGSGSSSSSERAPKISLTTSKSSPGLFEGIDLSTSSKTSKHQPKKATEQKSSSTSEIDKFFDNVFRIDWTL